jgi:hypothetical protein
VNSAAASPTNFCTGKQGAGGGGTTGVTPEILDFLDIDLAMVALASTPPGSAEAGGSGRWKIQVSLHSSSQPSSSPVNKSTSADSVLHSIEATEQERGKLSLRRAATSIL